MNDKLKAMLPDLGLVLIRSGLGISMMIHGWPKISNPEKWGWLGGQMKNIGIDFLPQFWGFMAAFSEFGGGLLFLLGLLTRISSGMMGFTMFIAMIFHIQKGDGYNGYGHALELMIVFIAMVMIGAGKYSLDRVLKEKFR